MYNYPTWIEDRVSPQHLWKMQNSDSDDGTSSNNRPLGYATDDNYSYVKQQLCEDTNYSMKIPAKGKVEIQDTSDMNTTALEIRQIGGWFMCSDYVKCPTSIYKEGGGVNNIAILMGFGNIPEAQVADKDDFYVQRIRYEPLKPNKRYHLFVRFSGTNYDADIDFFINGRKAEQRIVDLEIQKTTLASHGGDCVWGKSDVSLNMGSVAVSFGLDQEQYYSCWISESSKYLTDEEIFELFEYGAIPEVIATSQDDILNYVIGRDFEDAGIAIRYDVSGDDIISLDRVNFDKNTSIHLQYTGTGTLEVYLTPRVNLNQDRCTTPNNGTIIFKKLLNLKVYVYDLETKQPIEGARVFAKDKNTSDVYVNDVTNADGYVDTDLYLDIDFIAEIEGWVRKGSSEPYYKEAKYSTIVDNDDVIVNVFMQKDE